MSDTRTAVIVGGGIAGPVTALALRKAGIDATVYEAYDTTADGVGGGLSIAPNGLNALAVLDAGDVVRRIGIPVTAMVMQSWTGKTLARFGGDPAEPIMQFVWRADLYRGLRDELVRRAIPTGYGKRLVSVTESRDSVTAHFADGTHATGDILVGADGIRSTVRGLIDPAAPAPRYAGLASFGARMDQTGEPSTDGAMHMVFGKRAFFGYQVLDDGTGGWFVNLPQRTPQSLADARRTGAPAWIARLSEVFRDDRTPAARMISRTRPEDLLIVGPMEDVPTVPVWSRDRVVLVGDAAHATSPSSGQGASLAVESAVQLARCLRDLPHDKAFAAYESLRRARVERVIANAARTNTDKAAGPVARILRDLFLPVAMKLLAKPEKMAWQFGYRIDWDAPVAVSASPYRAAGPQPRSTARPGS
ncbi:MAG: FAD-dependent monooxygenase [Actinobacteria bacterium]|nr:MAG: FAD-dependent monooxygenase [Actinomycetota bacterium]